MLGHKARGLLVCAACYLYLFNTPALVMTLQEAKTGTFFYTLEKAYSSLDSQLPEYVASAPEFCTAPRFASIVGTGSNGRQAVDRLRYHITVI